MTDQTNTSAYWLDVANVAEQAETAAKAIYDAEPDGSAMKHSAMMAESHARDCRISTMKLRAMVMVREIEEVKAKIEEAVKEPRPFQVGDRVKVADPLFYNEGEIGQITRIDDCGSYPIWCLYNSELRVYKARELELVEAADASR